MALAYFLAASRGLPEGVSIFYATGMVMGIGLWLAASTSFVAVHAVLWTSKSGWRKPVRYALALILMSVPPFGITGWASPITAAGVLFPGWAWAGLMLTALGLSAITTRAWTVLTFVFGFAFAISVATWSAPKLPEGWVGIDTSFQYMRRGQHAAYARQQATLALIRQAARSGATRVVLPESAFGIWTPTTERFWARNLEGFDVALIGGATVVTKTGYDNVMAEVSGKGVHIIYRERMPVPVSMWQPWTQGGARVRFFENPVMVFGGRAITPLICYEQLLVWPVLQSMTYHPQIIVAIGNGWWTGESKIVEIQKSGVMAWASLFDAPLVSAFNK